MVYAGTLTERLYFYHVTETQSASGFKSQTEVQYYTCRADRLKNKENFVVNAEELFHFSHLTFKIRYNKNILENDIVKYNDERYRITSIDVYPMDKEETIIIEKINE